MKGMFGVFIGLVFSATAVAQQGTAELRGKVMDQQSAVLPGVADRPYKGAVPDITLCLIGPWALATAASPHTGIRPGRTPATLVASRPGQRCVTTALCLRRCVGPWTAPTAAMS